MILRTTILLGLLALVGLEGRAYLFTGMAITVEVFSEQKVEPVQAFMELCLADDMTKADAMKPCPGRIERVDCSQLKANAQVGSAQWDCLANEAAPARLGVKRAGKVLLGSTAFLELKNGEGYALHLQKDRIEAHQAPRDYFLNVGMTEMLENVFYPKEVKAIRELDRKGPGAPQTIDKPETRLVLKVCQNEGCQNGLQQEVSCSFETCGIRGLFYQCKQVPAFARYAEFSLFGRDKVRRSGLFGLKDKLAEPYGLNYVHINESALRVSSGKGQSCR